MNTPIDDRSRELSALRSADAGVLANRCVPGWRFGIAGAQACPQTFRRHAPRRAACPRPGTVTVGTPDDAYFACSRNA